MTLLTEVSNGLLVHRHRLQRRPRRLFLGQNDPRQQRHKTTLKAEINAEAWESLHSATSRPFDKPNSDRIAVKVINLLGDEVMKVFKVSQLGRSPTIARAFSVPQLAAIGTTSAATKSHDRFAGRDSRLGIGQGRIVHKRKKRSSIGF
ncbi:MAG: hypothetical protein AB7L90_26500 [Hyphomicrobiaceae bacterium]